MTEHEPRTHIIDEHGNRTEAKITWGPSHQWGMKLGPNTRRLPRITLRKQGEYWEARWVAQNGSYLAEQHQTRVGAIGAVVATARTQRWPILCSLDS